MPQIEIVCCERAPVGTGCEVTDMLVKTHADALEPTFLRPLCAAAWPLDLARALALVRPGGTCPVVTAEGP